MADENFSSSRLRQQLTESKIDAAVRLPGDLKELLYLTLEELYK